jgi:leader peptidase (prepilin peptidase) / N-methyltransferase
MLIAQTYQSLWVLQHVPVMVFVFCFGACVGSFLNVVIYRLPAGISVINPPSRCMTCGARLKFFRENLPILGWFLVRGKCRYCGVKLSPQYMIIELMMALMFLGLYIVLYAIPSHTPWWGQIGGQWWYSNTIFRTWPGFIAMAFMFAGLVAMTVIDARTFTIPIQIPLFVTITAFIAYPLQALLPRLPTSPMTWPIYGVHWSGFAMSAGGLVGVLISYGLLRAGKLRYSFADYGNYLPAASAGAQVNSGLSTDRVSISELLYFLPLTLGLIAGTVLGLGAGLGIALGSCLLAMVIARMSGLTFGDDTTDVGEQVLAPDYPHARREMGVELLYLGPCIVGMLMGYWVVRWTAPVTVPSPFLQAVGATLAGYLMGGGLVWGIRILGTLGFGREAMGLGDVHLLAAVGAVLGWFDPILIFFIAPFSGLLWAIGSIGIGSMFKKARRELPYGPHLAVATLVVILYRPSMQAAWQRYFPPTLPMPVRRFVPPPTPTRPVPPAPAPINAPATLPTSS